MTAASLCSFVSITLPGRHRDDGKRFVVCADEKLTAFVELQRAIHGLAVSLACTENRGRMVAL